MSIKRRLERLEALAAKRKSLAAERGDVVRSDTLDSFGTLTLEQWKALTFEEKIANDFGNDARERYKAMTLGEQNRQMREWIRQINDRSA